MKKLFNNKGYTLIELLTVIIILTSVGAIIASIFVSALRGGNKSNTTNEIRENGNYLIVQMSKTIRYAKSFDGVSDDGTNYVTNCVVPSTPTPTPEAVNYNYIRVSSFDGGQTVFSCENSSIASNGASLINTTNLNVTDCSFVCHQNSISESPTIDINFTLSKQNSGFFSENQTTIPFSTSVTVRN